MRSTVRFQAWLAAAVLLLVSCSDDSTTNPPPPPITAPQFVAVWGSQGSGDAQFDIPYDVACDTQGNVYVADTGNNRIQKFNSTGGFVTKWGGPGTGDGQFNSPMGITCDADGYVYVTDRFNHRVQKFTSDGVFVIKWGVEGRNDGEFDDPRGIDCDGFANVFVADFTAHMFRDNGAFFKNFGNNPYGLACDDEGNVYIASGWSVRKYRWLDGSLVSTWGSQGSADSQLQDATMLTYDHSRGVLYVVDRGNSRIQMFNHLGEFLDKWGVAGSGDGEFNWPTGIEIDGAGNVYVADTQNNRIQKFK